MRASLGYRMRWLAPVAVLVAAATGCDDNDGSRDPAAAAADIGDLPQVTRTLELPRLLDGGGLPGAPRPSGYETGWAFHDDRLACKPQERSVECGAILEVWGSEGEAKARSEYLKAFISSMPQELGIERHFREGRLLLRVTADLRNQDAEGYAAALH